MQITALIVAGCIFLAVSIMHLLRVIFKAKITVNDKVVPLWMSTIASPVVLLLAIYMFIAARQ